MKKNLVHETAYALIKVVAVLDLIVENKGKEQNIINSDYFADVARETQISLANLEVELHRAPASKAVEDGVLALSFAALVLDQISADSVTSKFFERGQFFDDSHRHSRVACEKLFELMAAAGC